MVAHWHLHRTDSTLTQENYCTTPLLRDKLHPVVHIFVEKDSYWSNILSPNAPQNFVSWRTVKKEESWLSRSFLFTVTWPQPHRTFLRAHEEWEKQAVLSSQESLWNPASVTCVVRFYTSLWSPRKLQCLLSLKDITNNNIMDIYQRFNLKLI